MARTKTSFTLFILFLIVANAVLAVGDEKYVQLVSNTDICSNCETIYNVCGAGTTIVLNSSNSFFEFRKEKTDSLKSSALLPQLKTWGVYQNVTATIAKTCQNPDNSTYSCDYLQDTYVPLDGTRVIGADECTKIKITGTIEPGSQVDNVLTVVIGGTPQKYEQWAFWNATDTLGIWDMNSTNASLDSSGNLNGFTNAGATNTTVYKLGGASMSFDATNNARRASLANLPSGNKNLTFGVWARITSALPSSGGFTRWAGMTDATYYPDMGTSPLGGFFSLNLINSSGYKLQFIGGGGNNATSNALTGLELNVWHHYVVEYLADSKTVCFWQDGVNASCSALSNNQNFLFSRIVLADQDTGDGTGRYVGQFDDVRVYRNFLNSSEIGTWYNFSSGTQQKNLSIAVSEPHSIMQSSYNVTSATGDGTVWRTNTSFLVNTSTPTPNVLFTTTTSSNCSMSLNNWNYTKMVSNDGTTKCGTIDTTSMNCTLPVSQSLTTGVQNLYISCYDAAGELGNTSTSGALNISLSVSESAVRTIMEGAINNVLGNPTIYSDQQIYIRRLNGTQALATFDKVAVSGQQRWAFNYLTGTDAYQRLGNLTPVLYTYETANISTAQLQSEIEAFITSTRN